MLERLSTIALGCGLLASLVVILIQKDTIHALRESNASPRVRRSAAEQDESVYFPVYTQISKKALRRLCAKERLRKERRTSAQDTTSGTPSTTPTTSLATPAVVRKRCVSEVNFSQATLVATRPNTLGSVIRDGEHWYVSEFHIGYGILQFSTVRTLNMSDPRALRSLPYPFEGTDNTVFNDTVYYNYDDSVVAYNLNTGHTQQIRMPINKTPIYNNSHSQMDIQAEEHGIWMIYRRNGEDSLSVSRLTTSLQIMSNWTLPALEASSLCNAFIRCGILYSVKCSDGLANFTPSYDFYQHIYINGRTTSFAMPTPNNVQYDPRSRSVNIFADSNIYTIDLS